MKEAIEILKPIKTIEIRGKKVIVKPLPLKAITPALNKMEKEKIEEMNETLINSLIDNVNDCCNLTDKEIDNLLGSEKIQIVETAISLDPELLKKVVVLLRKIAGG